MTEQMAFIFSIVFRIINFCILIALFWHIFSTYFYLDIKAQVRKHLDWWLILRDKIMQLRVKQKELDTAIANEEWEAQRLIKNMDRWRLFVQQEQKRCRQERQERMLKVHELHAMQEHNYQQTVLKRAYIPELFVRARIQLTTTYESPHKARVFIERTIDAVKDVP